MRSFTFLTISVILVSSHLRAQSLGSVNKAFNESYDASGKPFAKNPNANVDGSEVLNQNWGKGTVRMTRNKSYEDAELQFNIATQQLFFKKEGTIFAFGDNVLSFTMTYELNGKTRSVYFKNNYPAIGNQTNASFYQVIYEGKKNDLLKFLYKKKEERYEYNQPFKLVYTDEMDWYFFDKLNAHLVLIKNSMTDLQKKYTGNWEALTIGFQPKNKKHLSEEEMLQLFQLLEQ
jgi:hypothetical protein